MWDETIWTKFSKKSTYVKTPTELDKANIKIDELQQENKQLKDNWNKLKEMLREEIKLQEETYKKYGENNINIYYASSNKVVLDKMQELEKGNSNE